METFSGRSGALLAVLLLFVNSVFCDEINFYDENGSFSMIRTIGYGGCYKFAPVWDKRATAIDIVEDKSCFNVWKTTDCTGDKLKVTKKEGSYELQAMNFDKAISSVSLCSWDDQGRPDPMRGMQTYTSRPGQQYQTQGQQGSGNYGGGRVGGNSQENSSRRDYQSSYPDNRGASHQYNNRGSSQDGNQDGRRGSQAGVPDNDRPIFYVTFPENNRRGENSGGSGGYEYRREEDSTRRLPPQTSAPPTRQPTSDPQTDFAVQEINLKRAHLGAKEVKGNSAISADAQQWAESEATSHKLEATTFGNKYASTIATSFRKSKNDAIKDAIHRWYNKGSLSEYEREATEVGIGSAWNEREKLWVIVAFYHVPASYYIQKFHDENQGNIPSGRPLRS